MAPTCASIVLIILLAFTQAQAQVSKQLEDRSKKVAPAQDQSWKQVDQINNETDKTKSRYQQAQKAAVQPSQKSGYSVKRSSAGNPYKKFTPPKKTKTK